MSPESVTRLQLETSTSATPVNLLQTTWNLDGSVTCVLVVCDLKNVDKLLVSAKYFVLRKVAPSKELVTDGQTNFHMYNNQNYYSISVEGTSY